VVHSLTMHHDNDVTLIKINILVRGYVGSGKTTFCQAFSRLNEEDFTHSFEYDPRKKPKYDLSDIRPVPHYYGRYAASQYYPHTKTIRLHSFSHLLHPVLKTLMTRKTTTTTDNVVKTVLNDYTKVQITLIDTSGFDFDTKSLPLNMLRTIDAVLYLIPVEVSDQHNVTTALQWCKGAHTHLMNRVSHAAHTGTDPVSVVIFTKGDLLVGNATYQCYHQQVLQNHKAVTSTCHSANDSQSPQANLYTDTESATNAMTPSTERTMFDYMNNLSLRLLYKNNAFLYDSLFSQLVLTHPPQLPDLDYGVLGTETQPHYSKHSFSVLSNNPKFTSALFGINMNCVVYQLAAITVNRFIHQLLSPHKTSNTAEAVNTAGLQLQDDHLSVIKRAKSDKPPVTASFNPNNYSNDGNTLLEHPVSGHDGHPEFTTDKLDELNCC